VDVSLELLQTKQHVGGAEVTVGKECEELAMQGD